MMGAGTRSCGQFVSAAAANNPGIHKQMDTPYGTYDNEIARYQQWLQGFVTAYNSMHSDDLTKQIRVDLAGMDLWMRNWCNQNPTKSVFEAAIALVRDQAAK